MRLGIVGMALLRLAGQLVVVLTPLLGAQWSLVNWLSIPGTGPDDIVVPLMGMTLMAGPKGQVETKLQFFALVVGSLLVFAHDFGEKLRTARSLEEFRLSYIENTLAPAWRVRLGDDVRINILYAHRKWYLLFFRRFEWAWNSGFKPPNHQDANLLLTEFQGVCGQALRGADIKMVEFHAHPTPTGFKAMWLLCNTFHLFRWQLKKVQGLHVILSVPMFLSSGGSSPSHKPVGVINLDSTNAIGAKKIVDNAKALAEEFTEHGKVLALLRG